MITVRPPNPAKAGDIHELEVGWDPDMLAAVVRSILDPDRFATYAPRTRVALIAAGAPWMRRCGLLAQYTTDPLEDMS